MSSRVSNRFPKLLPRSWHQGPSRNGPMDARGLRDPAQNETWKWRDHQTKKAEFLGVGVRVKDTYTYMAVSLKVHVGNGRHRIGPSKYFSSGAEPPNTSQAVDVLVDLHRNFRDSFAKVPQKQWRPWRKRAPVRFLEGVHTQIPTWLAIRHGWLSVQERPIFNLVGSLALTFWPLTPVCRIHSCGRLRWVSGRRALNRVPSHPWSDPDKLWLMRWWPLAGLRYAMTLHLYVKNDCDACFRKNMRWIDPE